MSAKTIRIGMRGYASIVRCIVDGPVTRAQVMERCDIGRTAAQRILASLLQLRLVHIAGWEAKYRTAYLPAYGWGDKPDCAHPAERPNGKPAASRALGAVKLPAELIAFVSILRELSEASCASDVCEATGITERIARELLRHMHAIRLVRIALWTWRNGGGAPIPHYVFAVNGRDAARPAPMGRQTTNQRYLAGRRQKRRDRAVVLALSANASVFSIGQAA